MAEDYQSQNTDTQNQTTIKKKKKKGPSFGKIMLASGLGTLIVFIIVGIFKLLTLAGIVASFDPESSVQVKPNTILRIDLTKPMNERSYGQLNALMNDGSELGFYDLQRQLEYAATDDKIRGLYLFMGSSFPFSWGNSEELRQALLKFRESGKPIYAYADSYSRHSYYVASAADSIYLNPAGMVEFYGIGAEAIFFKELLDKLSVNITLIRPRNNSFKSAGERFTMDHMSDANRQQIREYISDIWDYVITQVAESRHVEKQVLNTAADKLTACLPADALQQKLIDRLCFEADIKKVIDEKFDSTNTITLTQYAKSHILPASAKDKIAIIYAEGDVKYGTGYGSGVYSDKITKAIDDAVKDNHIKAIVLRVNSPGGMVTASEIMANAVYRASKVKPLVVSMGDVAASAGYEMSCYATAIVAEPTTITGSIGVFAAIPELGTTMRRHLGITTDTVKTNSNALGLSAMRPMSPEVMELMQRNVEEFYVTFITRVADGRGLKTEFVDSIARGRVWTGRTALKLGLVDQLGGLSDAIALAAEKAGISQYYAYDYPANESLVNDIIKSRTEMQMTTHPTIQFPNDPTAMMPLTGDGVWMPATAVLELIKQIGQQQGLQARVEFVLVD